MPNHLHVLTDVFKRIWHEEFRIAAGPDLKLAGIR